MTVLVFDAGNVLIELGEPPIKQHWLPAGKSVSDVWADWIHMDAAREFEAGRSSDVEFANAMIASLGLQVDDTEFLQAFTAWPVGPYPGTVQWLRQVSQKYETAMLSNTNELHWRRMKDEMGLGDVMQHYFLSHKLNLVKPDAEIYQHVIDMLGTSADKIVFFDDNVSNVKAACEAGIRGIHVVGAAQLRSAFDELGAI